MPSRIGQAFPTPEQELLLKALLLPADAARKAWDDWRALGMPRQAIDWESYRLFPLLYSRLQSLGVADPWTPALATANRLEWSKNQILLNCAAGLLRQFQAAGIETMVLKGAALALLYYRDVGLRPMTDVDILVPTGRRRKAIEVLTAAGWTSPVLALERQTDPVLDLRHSLVFEKDAVQLDLHWHLLSEWRTPVVDEDVWTASIPIEVREVSSRVLDPAHQLLHSCFHGVASGPDPIPIWVVDSAMILTRSSVDLDWARLVEQARKRRLILPVREALAYLAEVYGAAVPQSVLAEMSSAGVMDLERKEYRAVTARRSVLGALPFLWYRYQMDLEAAGEKSGLSSFVGYPGYVLRARGDDLKQFLRWFLSRGVTRISEALRGSRQAQA